MAFKMRGNPFKQVVEEKENVDIGSEYFKSPTKETLDKAKTLIEQVNEGTKDENDLEEFARNHPFMHLNYFISSSIGGKPSYHLSKRSDEEIQEIIKEREVTPSGEFVFKEEHMPDFLKKAQQEQREHNNKHGWGYVTDAERLRMIKESKNK